MVDLFLTITSIAVLFLICWTINKFNFYRFQLKTQSKQLDQFTSLATLLNQHSTVSLSDILKDISSLSEREKTMLQLLQNALRENKDNAQVLDAYRCLLADNLSSHAKRTFRKST